MGRRCRQPRWLSAALPLWHSATLTLRFASRWLLILYKREFAPHDTMRLWEALWASKDKLMHLFYALAILRQHKHKIMEEEMEFDEVSFVFHDFAELGVRHAPAGGADVAAVVCSCY